jgi:nucleoside-diphosphate-sugar epimerase
MSLKSIKNKINQNFYKIQLFPEGVYMKNKKVAVIGGLGFIGSHLVEELCQQNEVVVIDNESTGSIKNINHLKFENMSLDLGDITQIDLKKFLEGCDCFPSCCNG